MSVCQKQKNRKRTISLPLFLNEIDNKSYIYETDTNINTPRLPIGRSFPRCTNEKKKNNGLHNIIMLMSDSNL